MSEYRHRMTLAVPEAFISQANQLALIVGENAADVNTFTEADWQDADGNLYAVCSTVIKTKVLELFGQSITSDNLYDHAIGADVPAAQKALDSAKIYEPDMLASADKIIIGIDIEPLLFFKNIGLTRTNESYLG